MTTENISRPTPIPYDQITPGYYWAQFTGPLEIVLVEAASARSNLGPSVYIFKSGHFRLPLEFRFWQRIETPHITLEDVSNARKAGK